MYEPLGSVALKTGEKVELGVVRAPDEQWAGRIEKLLEEKGGPWNWQNSHVLRGETGIECYFYVAHRDGEPISNIMTAELAGVGILGHVRTRPDERRKGAASQLMAAQMEHFRSRGGRALFLGTGFEAPAYHIYRRYNFESVEDTSGTMAYYSGPRDEFEAWYFADGPTAIEPVDWRHWPSSPALFIGDFGGVVRSAPLKRFGRGSTEGPLLYVIRDHLKGREEGEKPRALALVQKKSTAVVGLAVWGWHPLWPQTCLLDVYCHPNHWDGAGDLLAALELPEAQRYVAYGDAGCPQKHEILKAADFRQSAVLPMRLPANRARTHFVDVLVFEKP